MTGSRTNSLSKKDFNEMLEQAKLEIESLQDPFLSVAQKPLHMRFRQYLQNKASEIKSTMPLIKETMIVSSKTKSRSKEF